MLHTKFHGNLPAGSGEEDFLRFLPYGPQREKRSIGQNFDFSVKQILFEKRMFSKYFSVYLTGLFKLLGEIWFIYFLYPNDVIVM